LTQQFFQIYYNYRGVQKENYEYHTMIFTVRKKGKIRGQNHYLKKLK
jgi:hypothetical protein